jgi:hypothetical protein
MKMNWTLEKIHLEALKYKTVKEFYTLGKNAYQLAAKLGILDSVCCHMSKGHIIGDGNPSCKWTFDKLYLEAIKYKAKRQFRNGSYSAYVIALKRGFLDSICKHMKDYDGSGENHPGFKWTPEKVQEEASKYKTRSEFRINSGGSHSAAKRLNILDQVCSHMKRPGGTSREEKQMLDIIKDIYPSAKKIRDSKVKIEEKPHIHGFDIDIFIPELNLGIEMDGPYYHSFEFMRKDPKKIKWSDEDIKNYDNLKDSWFLSSKGITVTHIKWTNWKKDKQACINKCLEFLGVAQKKVA